MGEKESIKKGLKRFKNDTTKHYPIQKLIFFGSRASGRPKQDSDIDLIVVSPKFRRLNFFERGARMYDYWNLHYPVDFLCYTPEEFKKLSKQITIVREAVKEGIEIS